MQGIYGVRDSGKVYAKVTGTQMKLRLSLLEGNMMSFPDETTLDFILEEQEGVCFPGRRRGIYLKSQKEEANFRQSEMGERWVAP